MDIGILFTMWEYKWGLQGQVITCVLLKEAKSI